MPADRPHVALYAGSFDPITLGHLDVLQRARRIFDRLVLDREAWDYPPHHFLWFDESSLRFILRQAKLQDVRVKDIIFGNGLDARMEHLMERQKVKLTGEARAARLGIKEIQEQLLE